MDGWMRLDTAPGTGTGGAAAGCHHCNEDGFPKPHEPTSAGLQLLVWPPLLSASVDSEVRALLGVMLWVNLLDLFRITKTFSISAL